MVFLVRTCKGEFYVESSKETLRKRMWAYIREELKKGRGLAQITYSYTPIHVTRRLP